VTHQQGIALFVVLVVGAGSFLVLVRDHTLGRVLLSCGLLPIGAAAVIGLAAPFFIDRTVTVSAWAPCLAIGFLVERVWRRSELIGCFAVVLTALLILPSTITFLERHWEYDASARHLAAVARDGDVVATVPDWYGALVDWRIAVREFGAAPSTTVPGLADAHAVRLGSAKPSGRVWTLSFAGDERRFPGLARCAPDWTDGVTTVSCLVPKGGK
jgi:hypothetical protein